MLTAFTSFFEIPNVPRRATKKAAKPSGHAYPPAPRRSQTRTHATPCSSAPVRETSGTLNESPNGLSAYNSPMTPKPISSTHSQALKEWTTLVGRINSELIGTFLVGRFFGRGSFQQYSSGPLANRLAANIRVGASSFRTPARAQSCTRF